MPTVCPVCETTPPDSATHCPKCGFPTGLYPVLHGPISLGPAPVPEEALDGPVSGPAAAHAGTPSPETLVNASIVHGLEERVTLLATVDRDAPDVTGELCEAALNEASGRAADAQQVLRSAQGRLQRETEELIGRHVADLEARARLLQETGLRFSMDDPLARVSESALAGDIGAAVGALAAAERRLGLIEAHWRGLQALVAQVMTLRGEAESLGIDVDRACARLDRARADLSTRTATEHDLDAAAQAAAEALMALHEAVPPALESELDRHRASLDAHDRTGRSTRSARRVHSDAEAHLREGRLDNAILSLRELRAELARLEREPPPPPPPPPTPEPTPRVAEPPARGAPATRAPTPTAREPAPTNLSLPAVPSAPPATSAPTGVGAPTAPPAVPASSPSTAPGAEPDVVGNLMRKARSLAARVRALPPDSEEAASAARAIHEATELLKARRFAEADAALTRLMRTLASARSRS